MAPGILMLVVAALLAAPCLAITSSTSSTTASPKTAPDPAQSQQQEQARSQARHATLLEALSKGTLTTAPALQLLQDARTLRASLQSGAAAARVRHRRQAGSSSNSSRGILIVAGGRHQFRNAYILLRLLWHSSIRCSLPVELVHYCHERDEAVARAMQQHAQGSGMRLRVIDGSSVAPSSSGGSLEPHATPRQQTGYKAKIHALAWVTSFDEVLLLDSDNTPLADPSSLFDAPAFREHGSLFWPDFWQNQWMQPAIYSLLGLDTPWEANPGFRASESGQLLLDRRRHADVREWLWLLNLHSNSGVPGAAPGAVGQCLWGDKDTFYLAFHLAGKGQHFSVNSHTPLQALARPGGAGSSRLVHAGMVHRAPVHPGPLLWLHRTAAGKFWPHCAIHGGKTCQIWGFTTPLDQAQLLATVAEPSAMEMALQQLDTAWPERHCSGVGVDASTNGQCALAESEGGATTVLPCDLDAAAGALPIPVLTAEQLPQQVRVMLAAAQEAFEASRVL